MHCPKGLFLISLSGFGIICDLDTFIMRLSLLVWRRVIVTSAMLAVRTHHLLDPMKALPMKTERLFKQHLVLHRPLIREGGEVGQISKGLLDVVFMPEEHAESLWSTEDIHALVNTDNNDIFEDCVLVTHLLNIVSMLFFCNGNVLIHWKEKIIIIHTYTIMHDAVTMKNIKYKKIKGNAQILTFRVNYCVIRRPN